MLRNYELLLVILCIAARCFAIDYLDLRKERNIKWLGFAAAFKNACFHGGRLKLGGRQIQITDSMFKEASR